MLPSDHSCLLFLATMDRGNCRRKRRGPRCKLTLKRKIGIHVPLANENCCNYPQRNWMVTFEQYSNRTPKQMAPTGRRRSANENQLSAKTTIELVCPLANTNYVCLSTQTLQPHHMHLISIIQVPDKGNDRGQQTNPHLISGST